jgi:phage/conjugal plasmid C-4 type zinc finger TraR family protein
MDITDHATESEDTFRQQALDRQRAQLPRGESALFCKNIYCGEEIPEERRQAIPGVQHCIHCQKLKERGALR